MTTAVGSDSLEARLLAFVVEQHPFALAAARAAWIHGGGEPARVIEALRDEARDGTNVSDLPETTPFVCAAERLAHERARLLQAVEGFFAREAIAASLTDDDKRWMLRGVILTRAVDSRMKQLFLSSEMKYGELGFQGKGFRSLGQEAIYAGALRLQRGDSFSVAGQWQGDVIGPLIRDLGMTLAFTDGLPDQLERALNAQVGKDGPPSSGKDLHLGHAERGVIMVAAPLSIATCTVTGYALAFKRRFEQRVAFSFIGEGGSSLGEWHEAINLAAAMKLPAVFVLENNQTALSTPVREQSQVRVFADKAQGYGIPHVTIDGTDPEAIACAFAWAAARARAGHGPTLLETVAMRMCGHAHHDDMLYLGHDPPLGFELPPLLDKPAYVDRAKYAAWSARDPLASYARRLLDAGVIDAGTVAAWQDEASARVEQAVARLHERPWPAAAGAARGLFAMDSAMDSEMSSAEAAHDTIDEVEDAPAFQPKGATFLEAIGKGIEDVLAAVPESFVLGEDVGPPYGNAFLLLKPLLEKHAARLVNTPIAEGAILGACVGAALAGLRPIGEMQFNDFVASGFNQLVNNAAKLHYRAGTKVPMTVRMPWGGLRRAGPFHSQDTAPWFFRTAGLKIVVPSTPHDARALMMSAVLDDNPVLFYEHIALYRDPKIKQAIDVVCPVPLGKAAFRRLGEDLSLISYGAFVHKALSVARVLAEEGIECTVLDLRSLSPLDWPRIARAVQRTSKVMLIGEDSRTGSILESIAARIGEELFTYLDGPVKVMGSLDTPVPYAPSLEDAYLLNEAQILKSARALVSF